MLVDRQLQILLYDPVSYVVGWQHIGPTLTAHGRSVLNEVLVHQHALPPFAPTTRHEARWIQRIVRNWNAIPAAAYLMACSLWRDRLAGERLFQQLEPQVHAFLQFEFQRMPVDRCVSPKSRHELMNWGGSCIPIVLPDLPPWLSRRIALRFDERPPEVPEPNLTHNDLTRFSMALAHAQKDPRFCDSLRP